MNHQNNPSAWDDKPIDVSNEVNFIWSVATLLHAVAFKDADHRDVILPMTVLRRLECALAPTKERVVIKTGAEFPFTRYFYKYQECEPSEKIMGEIAALEKEIGEELKSLKEVE